MCGGLFFNTVTRSRGSRFLRTLSDFPSTTGRDSPCLGTRILLFFRSTSQGSKPQARSYPPGLSYVWPFSFFLPRPIHRLSSHLLRLRNATPWFLSSSVFFSLFQVPNGVINCSRITKAQSDHVQFFYTKGALKLYGT